MQVVNLTKQGINTELFHDNWLFHYCQSNILIKTKKAYEEMNVFLSAFRLLSKVKAAKHTSRTCRRWRLSSDIPTGKYEKNDRANEFYKSETRTSDNSDQYRTQHYAFFIRSDNLVTDHLFSSTGQRPF